MCKIKRLYFFLHSMEKKSIFLPFRVKKHYSTLEMDTFKVMMLFFIPLCSIKNLVHDFKRSFFDIEITNSNLQTASGKTLKFWVLHKKHFLCYTKSLIAFSETPFYWKLLIIGIVNELGWPTLPLPHYLQ